MGFLGIGSDKVTTTTNTLGERDTGYTIAQRRAGVGANEAAMAGPWAMGPRSDMQGYLNQYGSAYGDYGQLANRYGAVGRYGMEGAMQSGLNGMGAYMNPMWDQYTAGMNPEFDHRRAGATTSAMQNATGQGAYGGSRGQIAEAMQRADIDRMQNSMYGDARFQMGRDAAGMMMGERERLQRMGFMGMHGEGGAYGAQVGVTDKQGTASDYMRAQEERARMDEFTRRSGGLNALGAGYGRDTETINEVREKGNPFGDLLALGGVVSSFIPGGGGSAQTWTGSPGAGAGYNMQSSPLFNPGANLYNYGGYSGFGAGANAAPSFNMGNGGSW